MAKRGENYTDEFKMQIVLLHESGKSVNELVLEFGVSKTSINKWIRDYKNSGSFKAKDNRSDLENQLLLLQKENKQLRMENDILKQAAVIIGEK